MKRPRRDAALRTAAASAASISRGRHTEDENGESVAGGDDDHAVQAKDEDGNHDGSLSDIDDAAGGA